MYFRQQLSSVENYQVLLIHTNMTNTHSWQSVTILSFSESVANLYKSVQSNLYVNIRSAYAPLMGIFKGRTFCLRLEYLIRLLINENFKTLCIVTEEI